MLSAKYYTLVIYIHLQCIISHSTQSSVSKY